MREERSRFLEWGSVAKEVQELEQHEKLKM